MTVSCETICSKCENAKPVNGQRWCRRCKLESRGVVVPAPPLVCTRCSKRPARDGQIWCHQCSLDRLCSKCGENFATKGQRYCRPCHSAYQRIWRHKLRLPPSIPRDNFFSTTAWQVRRYQALVKYGAQCQCCGVKPPEAVMHVDHIKPRSKYPELELEITNLQILCADCNRGKLNIDTTDWRPPATVDGDVPRGTISELKALVEGLEGRC